MRESTEMSERKRDRQKLYATRLSAGCLRRGRKHELRGRCSHACRLHTPRPSPFPTAWNESLGTANRDYARKLNRGCRPSYRRLSWREHGSAMTANTSLKGRANTTCGATSYVAFDSGRWRNADGSTRGMTSWTYSLQTKRKRTDWLTPR